MPDRIARVWSGSAWESVSSPTSPPNAVVYYQATAPSSPVSGQAWFDSSVNILKVWSGTAWVSTSIDLSLYATISYVSNADNIPTLNSTKVPTASINTQTSSYTLVASDAGKVIYLNNSLTSTITVPTNASVPFSIGTKIDIIQAGISQVTISGASGVTINSEGNKNKILSQWCGVSLLKTETDTWVMLGALRV